MRVRAQGGSRGDASGRGSRGHLRRSGRRTALALAAVLVASLAAAGCDSGGAEPAPKPTPSASGKPTKLTFGVYGPADEVDAFQGVVDVFNSLSDDSDVTISTYADHDGLIKAIESGDDVPDVFMASRSDLAWLLEHKLTQPVDEMLDERGVDFGDGYSRDALQAFSADSRLQCMPYGISPMVIYYNKALIDFDRMRARGLDAPDLGTEAEPRDPRWSFEQFTAAAQFATRPRKQTRGLYVDPTLRGLAPFVYSGGGKLFDDDVDPTSLALSDSDTQAALEQALVLLRNPQLTLTERQLDRATPLQWFERGRLGMIEGFRSLVPELRQVQGLDFDVMPMPILDSSATTGDITGLCISAAAASAPEAADFLVHALSPDSVGRVVATGYLAPANLEVALSDTFLQPGRLPDHASVFNSSVRALELPPLIDSWAALEAAVAPNLQELLTVPVLDLAAQTAQIDEESRAVLDPTAASESPSSSP
ncbi:MAG: carbohydrate transporter substrate-binding protein family [Nocardioides sp.]|nr:carbohydrate transporter substrate-binding protein family [Nocardioides sp.]